MKNEKMKKNITATCYLPGTLADEIVNLTRNIFLSTLGRTRDEFFLCVGRKKNK